MALAARLDDRSGTRHQRRPARLVNADRRLGYALVAPVVILLLLITAYPLIYNLWNSFHTVNLSIGNSARPFVGVDNYRAMVQSAAWRGALERTAIFTVVSVAFETTVGLGLAVMLNQKFRGRGLLRASI